MPNDAITAIFLFVLVFAGGILAGYSKLRLMHKYRVHEYTAVPHARRLYWTARFASLLVGIALVSLASMTHIWWIETAAWMFFAYIIGVNIWALQLRFSGKYVEFYRARQWK
jgi:hypothetical protein